MPSVDQSSDDEVNFPEKVTEVALRAWAESRSSTKNQSLVRNQLHCRNHGVAREAEQHQMGLSAFMKRYRHLMKNRQAIPDLVPKVDRTLPRYLQDVQRFNPELMNTATTEEHYTLPTKEDIEEERRLMEEGKRKAWDLGIVLNKNENLIDPNWKREDQERFLNEVQRETRERSAYVMVGVLQQWTKAPDKGSALKPISNTATRQTGRMVAKETASINSDTTNSSKDTKTATAVFMPSVHSDNTFSTSTFDTGRLETLTEVEEEESLHSLIPLHHSSR